MTYTPHWIRRAVTTGFLAAAAAALAAPASAQVRPPAYLRRVNPDEREVGQYRLSLEMINKVTQAKTRLAALAETDVSIRLMMSGQDDRLEKGVDDMVGRMDGMPPVKQAIEAAGLTSRDYLLTEMTLFSSLLIAQMKSRGMMAEMPPDVAPENVTFIEQHDKELAPILAEWDRLGQAIEKP